MPRLIIHETTYFEVSFGICTLSKTLHLCCTTVKLATARPFRGSLRFAAVKSPIVAKLAKVKPSHGKPAEPHHGKLPEFRVLPLCSFMYCIASASTFVTARANCWKIWNPHLVTFLIIFNHGTHLRSFACVAFHKQAPGLALY